MKIGFIGAGNMGGAILKGYAKTAAQNGDQILVFDINEEKRTALEQQIPVVSACSSEKELARSSDVILLGVKPNMFETLLPQIAEECTSEKVIVSMAAGVSIGFIQSYLGSEQRIIRIMPNTPAQVSESMVAVCRNQHVDDQTFRQVFGIFEAIGRAEEVDEALIHCVIGVSGSSPAYTYMYIDALIQAAVDYGMDEAKAKVFAAQSVLGAAKMVLETDISPEQLRINVCSPGGTTIEAVNKLMENGFMDHVKEGFAAAVEKSKAMTK